MTSPGVLSGGPARLGRAAGRPIPPGRRRHSMGAAPRTVLVLEDDPVQNMVCRRILQDGGFTAVGCAAPSQLWAALGQGAPAAVLVDILLPEMDGFAVIEKLQAGPAW